MQCTDIVSKNLNIYEVINCIFASNYVYVYSCVCVSVYYFSIHNSVYIVLTAA